MEIANHSEDLFQKVYREFSCNCLWVDLGRDYRESKYFKEAVLCLVFNFCELNPTNKLGKIIHEFLKLPFFKEPDQRRGIYKQIKYILLPVLWKNHRSIEKKKQKNYRFLPTN